MFTNFRAVVSSPDLWIVEDHLVLIDFRNEAVEVVAELFQRRIKRHLVHGSGQLSATGTRRRHHPNELVEKERDQLENKTDTHTQPKNRYQVNLVSVYTQTSDCTRDE